VVISEVIGYVSAVSAMWDSDYWPEWATWKGSRAGLCIRWIETYLRVPSGHGAGEPLRLAEFQRDLIEELLADGVRSGGFQIGAGNAKSTLAAAIGLWAVASTPDSPQVPLIAYNGLQANRTLFTPMRHMVRMSPVLDARADGWLKVRMNNNERGIESRWNGGELWPLPADDERLQGLNPTLTLIDEAEFVPLDVLQSIEDRHGKRAESVTLTFGTPGPDMTSALFHVRSMHQAGAPYRWVEHAAPEGCEFDDPAAWRLGNPAIDAGFLDPQVFVEACDKIRCAPVHTRPVLEARFRLYRLGQWGQSVQEAGWLPDGAFAACRQQDPPRPGSRIVVALDGTYKRTTAIVGASLDDQATFLLYAAEQAGDDELGEVLDAVMARWEVVELVHPPSIRSDLMRGRVDRGDPVEQWDTGRLTEVSSANSLWQAVTEGVFVHDGHPLMAEHFANVTSRETPAGITLMRKGENRWVDVAMAARMAWWRAKALAELTPSVW
jgi:phage terminase large subunit-like protein